MTVDRPMRYLPRAWRCRSAECLGWRRRHFQTRWRVAQSSWAAYHQRSGSMRRRPTLTHNVGGHSSLQEAHVAKRNLFRTLD